MLIPPPLVGKAVSRHCDKRAPKQIYCDAAVEIGTVKRPSNRLKNIMFHNLEKVPVKGNFDRVGIVFATSCYSSHRIHSPEEMLSLVVGICELSNWPVSRVVNKLCDLYHCQISVSCTQAQVVLKKVT